MEEVWKDVVGYEGYYQVSNLGMVRGLDRPMKGVDQLGRPTIKTKKGKLIKQYPTHKGYMQVFLSKENKRKTIVVHRLVAKAFCSGYADGFTVDHLNYVKTDNRAENLEWCSSRENLIRSHRVGTHGKGVIHPESRVLTRAQIDEIKEIYWCKENIEAANPWVKPYPQRRLAKMFNVSQCTIKEVLRGNVKAKDE